MITTTPAIATAIQILASLSSVVLAAVSCHVLTTYS